MNRTPGPIPDYLADTGPQALAPVHQATPTRAQVAPVRPPAPNASPTPPAGHRFEAVDDAAFTASVRTGTDTTDTARFADHVAATDDRILPGQIVAAPTPAPNPAPVSPVSPVTVPATRPARPTSAVTPTRARRHTRWLLALLLVVLAVTGAAWLAWNNGIQSPADLSGLFTHGGQASGQTHGVQA